jgi:nucleoside-diphosphate-sugar epimerase
VQPRALRADIHGSGEPPPPLPSPAATPTLPELHLNLLLLCQVFDGKKGSYLEGSDEALRPTPVNAYGASKLAAEHAALALPCSIVLRLSLVYGPTTPRGGNKTSTFLQFMDGHLANASAPPLQLFSDEIRCPIAVADVCDACCRLVLLHSSGLPQLRPFLHQRVHCGGPDALSRVAMGQTLCQIRGYSFSSRVQSVTRDALMSDAAFKFASPPDISMRGSLLAQLLQVRALPADAGGVYSRHATYPGLRRASLAHRNSNNLCVQREPTSFSDGCTALLLH